MKNEHKQRPPYLCPCEAAMVAITGTSDQSGWLAEACNVLLLLLLQVSCGTFHTCAVSSGGRLFSWGDGLCGKLGQGHLHTCPEPCQVAALADQTVLHVACGVWHTACIARPRQSQDKAGSVSSLEGALSGSLSLEDSAGERALLADVPAERDSQFRTAKNQVE